VRRDVLVIAVGNRSRGDDALGPLLLDRLEAWLADASRPADAARFELLEDYQLQPEHALDVQDRALVLFVDAATDTDAPVTLRRVLPGPAVAFTTHAMEPAQVLEVFQRALGGPVPPAWSLCVSGESFGLGEPPTSVALANLDAAWALLRTLCLRPDAQAWQALSVHD
jgi:hydrogenase maturation protease